MIGRHQLAAEQCVIGPLLPIEVQDLVRGSQMRRRIAMAIEAHLHREGLCPVGQGHTVDPAVALDAGDALRDVDVVAEIDIVGHSSDAVQSIERFSARLSRTGASIAAFVHICEWQVMQTWVAGKPALALVSTVLWQ
jgi:hypothetical protein